MKICSLLTLILLSISNYVYCQSEYIFCDGKMTRFSNGHEGHFRKIVCCPMIQVGKDKFPKKIIESNISYLIKRVGNEFYKKLSSPTFEIMRLDLIETSQFRNSCVTKKNCENKMIKYAIIYHFDLFQGMKYYFTLLYDNNGILISDDQLPNHKLNPNFSQIIEPCKAIKIANNDTVYKKSSNHITLDFSQQFNSFVWVVEKDQLENYTERTFHNPILTINATTGLILNQELSEKFSVCDGNRPSYPNLKR